MNHKETLVETAAWHRGRSKYRLPEIEQEHARMADACLSGAEALRLLPLALAGDLCGCYNSRLASARRRTDCAHPDCVSVRALLATEVTR